MGIFISIMNRSIDWLALKTESPMNRVAEWFIKYDLEEYTQTFEDYGWDNLPVLLEMTEKDIGLCIQKPGHKAKFKRALRYLKIELDNPIATDRSDLHEETNRDVVKAATVETESKSTEEKFVTYTKKSTAEAYSSEQGHYATSISENVQFKSNTNTAALSPTDTDEIKEPMSTIDNVDDKQFIIAPEEIQVPGIVHMINNNDEDNVQAELTNICTHTAHERDGIIKDVTNTNSSLDEHAPNKDMAVSKGISVVSGNLLSQVPSIQADGKETTVNLTIIKHSEHTSIGDTAVASPEYMRTPLSFDNPQDEMITIASAFEKKDELYVETMAYKELKTIIEDRYWATLLGKAGDGKSATAAHLLLHYKRQGYRPVFLSSARKWEEMLNSGKLSGKTFVMIDDMFGSIHIDNKKVEDWLSVIEIMEKIVKERDGELLIVCTSRRHVFTDVESKLYRCCCFTKTSAVDMTDEEFRLSSNEKSAILRKFVDTYDVNVDEEMLEMIKDVDPPHGFPHCVEMFFTNVFLRESGVSFFQNPEEFVKQELNNFKDNDPLKFLVLLLVLYKQNRVHPSYFGKVQGNADKEVVELFKSTGIPQSTAYSHMLKAVDSLTNTYLTQGSDGYYSFTHESLKENVSEVYISLSPLHATELLNLQQIITYMNKPKSKLKTSLTCNLSANVKLPENKLIEKVTTELLISSDVSTVIKCAVWFDQAFVDEWIKFITMPCESESIPACLSEYLLRKIVFPDIQRYDKTLLQGGFDSGFTLRSLNLSRPNIDCFTLVTSLLKNNMTCAAIAILRNKCIQEVLGQDIKWHRSLKKGLEIVCSKTCDTGVIKAILASQDEINSRRLNGSNALMYALQSSNAECASHLLENTRIMFDKGNNETYFRHILNSNIDLSNFKQLCDLLIAAGADITENKNGIPLLHTCFVIAKADICIKNLEYLLELTSNIDVRSSKNSTNIVAVVLEKLTVKQCLSILPILKERNADFHHVNQRDMNALHIICQKQPLSQYLEVVQYLIKIGVNIAQRSNDGAVPLMFACQNDPGIECLKQLLKGSPQDHTNKLGQGYIHYLLQSNCMLASLEKYFRVLLVANANINLQDKSGRTAAMLLLQNSLEHRKCAKELIAFMDLLNSSGMEFHLTDAGGRNVLHYVFGYRHVNQPSRLQRSSVSTPLVSKTRIPVYNQTDSSVLSAVFEYLVETIKVDCFLADVNGVNPLMLALLNYPNSVAVTTLINRNVPDQKDKTGATYFHYLADSRAVSRERLNSIESTLMSQGLDLDTSVLKIPFDGLSHRKKQRVLPVL